MSKRLQLDNLCDEMDITEQKYLHLDLGARRLQDAIDAVDLVNRTIALDPYEILGARETLDAMHDDVMRDRAKVANELREVAVEFDRLVDEYFEETGNYYYPIRMEWPAWSSIEPSWMKASRRARKTERNK